MVPRIVGVFAFLGGKTAVTSNLAWKSAENGVFAAESASDSEKSAILGFTIWRVGALGFPRWLGAFWTDLRSGMGFFRKRSALGGSGALGRRPGPVPALFAV